MRSFLEGGWGNLLYRKGSPNLTSLNAHRYSAPARDLSKSSAESYSTLTNRSKRSRSIRMYEPVASVQTMLLSSLISAARMMLAP